MRRTEDPSATRLMHVGAAGSGKAESGKSGKRKTLKPRRRGTCTFGAMGWK
jgi:hypothetical protein